MRTVITAAAILAATLGTTAAAPATVAVPGARAFPESVTSTGDGTLYVGSIGEGGILRAAPGAAEAEPWIAPGSAGTRSIFGLLADERTGTLWTCSNDVSGMGIASPGNATGSALKAFDLATGALKSSAALPGERPFCNDIAIGPDGRVYVTDTIVSRVLRLAPDGSTLEVWSDDARLKPGGDAPGADGLVFGRDGALYLTTYGGGDLLRIAVGPDGTDGQVTKLTPSRPLVLPDTLRLLEDGRLLLVEGGGTLDLVTLDGDAARIETLAGGFDTPVSVTRVGDTAWVAEGQLGLLFDPALKGQQPKLPFRIVAVPLGSP